MIAPSCQSGCVTSKCTNVLTDPASYVFKMSAIVHYLQSWAYLVEEKKMHDRNPVVQSTSPGISHRYPCLHIVLVDANSGCFQSCQMWLQLRCIFSSPKSTLLSMMFVVRLIGLKKASTSPVDIGKALYKLLRLAPVHVLTIKSDCLLSQILNVNAIAHAFADSQRTHTTCNR